MVRALDSVLDIAKRALHLLNPPLISKNHHGQMKILTRTLVAIKSSQNGAT